MSPQRDLLKIGVIGAGFIAQVAHLPSFERLQDCRIAALADNRGELLEMVADRHNITARFTDYHALIAEDGVDAVVVAMPRRAQSAVVRDVLSAGRPVLTEKPMAYTARVADELAAMAALSGTPLAVGYTRLYDPGVRLFCKLLGEAMSGGEMGAMVHVRMADFCGAYTVTVPPHTRSTEKRPFRYPEDPLAPEFVNRILYTAYDYTVNVASHNINLLRSLFGGRLEPISFRVRPGGVQHAVFAQSHVDVELSVGPAQLGVWEQRIDIYFQKGCLSLLLESPLAWQACGTVVRRRPTGEEIIKPPVTQRMFAFDLQAAAFLDALRNGTPFAADGSEAAKDVQLIEALWSIASLGS